MCSLGGDSNVEKCHALKSMGSFLFSVFSPALGKKKLGVNQQGSCGNKRRGALGTIIVDGGVGDAGESFYTRESCGDERRVAL